VGQKIAPFLFFHIFCNNFVKPHYIIIFDTVWHTDTEVHLQRNCPPLLTAVLALPRETNVGQLFITAVIRFKVMIVTEKHIANKCSVFALSFETCIKTISPLINRLINEALLVADQVSIRCCFSSLTSHTGFWQTCSYVSVTVGVSRCWCTGVVFMQPEWSEWCILLWCLAAQTVAARHLSSCWQLLLPAHHTWARALSCCDTRLRTSHQPWPPNRPDLSCIESHSWVHLSETTRDVKHRRSELWLLKDKWYFINIITYILQGGAETPVRRKNNYDAVLFQIYFRIIKIKCGLTKLLQK